MLEIDDPLLYWALVSPLYAPLLMGLLGWCAAGAARAWVRVGGWAAAVVFTLGLCDVLLLPEPWGRSAAPLSREDFTIIVLVWIGCCTVFPFLLVYGLRTLWHRHGLRISG